jgi:acetyl-CoA decarbonylase/synthase complex subunit gamma
MALTALEIYKYLPKTNCKKCGLPTCLAFAMKLAAKQTSLDKCPEISEEARNALTQASEPPLRTITLGHDANQIKVGGDVVLFRHEKTFYNPTAFGVLIKDDLSEDEIKEKIEKVKSLEFERVGQKVKVEIIAIENKSGDLEKYLNAIKLAIDSGLILILISKNYEFQKKAIELAKDKKPLLYGANKNNWAPFLTLAKENQLVLGIEGENLEDLIELVDKIKEEYKDLIINPSPKSISEGLSYFTIQRRLAIKKNYRSVGFPIIAFVKGEDKQEKKLLGSATYIAKYADILISDEVDRAFWLTLVTLRFNIYTDPQKPVTVEPKLYQIGQAKENSPLLVTTNFSLTFYTVSPEIENSKIPSHLLVVDTEGLSVLTAWAADKLNADVIAKWMKDTNVEQEVNHRKIIIPGYVAVLSGKLEDETGWEVMVGPKEASGIPKFLRQKWETKVVK